jgi:hypothetical protein
MQFISRDPALSDAEASAYQYCAGEPVGKTDPTGLEPHGYGYADGTGSYDGPYPTDWVESHYYWTRGVKWSKWTPLAEINLEGTTYSLSLSYVLGISESDANTTGHGAIVNKFYVSWGHRWKQDHRRYECYRSWSDRHEPVERLWVSRWKKYGKKKWLPKRYIAFKVKRYFLNGGGYTRYTGDRGLYPTDGIGHIKYVLGQVKADADAMRDRSKKDVRKWIAKGWS